MGSVSRHLSSPAINIKVGTRLDLAERLLILATLDACEGNKSAAAELLGISLKTVYNKLRSYQEPVALGLAPLDAFDEETPEVPRRTSILAATLK